MSKPEPVHFGGTVYFDPTRCVQCNAVRVDFKSKLDLWQKGGFLTHNDHIGFCSDACYEKALRPFLPDNPGYNDLVREQYEDEVYFEETHDVNESGKAAYLAMRQRHRDEQAKHAGNPTKAWAAARSQFLRHYDAEVKGRMEKDNKKRSDDFEELCRRTNERIAIRQVRWDAEEREEARKKQEFEEMIKPRPIPDHIRYEHTLIVGGSGAGKTTLIQQLILDDLAKPDPPAMVIIDPKGLMIDRLQRLALFNPDNGRLKDRIVVIDPTQSPALNMFDPGTNRFRMYSDTVRRQIESQAISNFSYIFSSVGSKLTDKQSVPFTFVVRLLFTMKAATIHTLVDVLDDPAKTLAQSRFAPDIGRLDDMSRRFFANDYFTSNYSETRQQIKSRLFSLLMRPEFVEMFSRPERRLDMVECLQQRKIVLVNTSMGILGPEGSQTFGRYIIALVLNAAFARIAMPRKEWNPAFLIVDEFQEYADELKTPELLRMAREYNLGVVMATQVLHGSPFNDALRNSMSVNTSIKYAAGVEAQDLGYMARDMRCQTDFITSRKRTATHANFACYVRNLLDHPMSIEVPLGNVDRQPQMTQSQLQRLLHLNAQRLTETRRSPEGSTLLAPVAPGKSGGLHPAPRQTPSAEPDPGEPSEKWE